MATPSGIPNPESGKRGPEPDTIPQPSPKRRNISKKGCLQSLLDAPSNLFSTVASYCEPRDLLSMARSCKMLRGVLMSKQSHSIWIESCKGIGLPACPPDLSEPQYAELMLGRQCQNCSTKRTIIFLNRRIRLCSTCWREQSCPVDDLSTLSSKLESALDKEEIEKIGKILDRYNCTSDIWYEQRWYKPQLQQLARKKKEMTPDGWRSYLESSTMQWVFSEAFEVSIMEMSGWLDLEQKKKSKKKCNIRDERRCQIEAKLVQEGFSKKDVSNIRFIRRFRRKLTPFEKDTRPLTDRIWQRIKPELIAVIEEYKKHMEEVRESILAVQPPEDPPQPQDLDFFQRIYYSLDDSDSAARGRSGSLTALKSAASGEVWMSGFALDPELDDSNYQSPAPIPQADEMKMKFTFWCPFPIVDENEAINN